MSDWLPNLPVLWMAVVVFAATYLLAASIYWVVTMLAVSERALALRHSPQECYRHWASFSRCWLVLSPSRSASAFDKAKVAVASEASALRAVVLLAGTFPEEQKARIYALLNRHIEEAANKEWPAILTASDPFDFAHGSDRGIA